jgi:plasmid maintenance system killer protein
VEIRFTNKKLEALYTEGKSAKYKLDDRVLQAFFEVVAILEAAHDIYDLWSQPSLNFERLKGSSKWRLTWPIPYNQLSISVPGRSSLEIWKR